MGTYDALRDCTTPRDCMEFADALLGQHALGLITLGDISQFGTCPLGVYLDCVLLSTACLAARPSAAAKAQQIVSDNIIAMLSELAARESFPESWVEHHWTVGGNRNLFAQLLAKHGLAPEQAADLAAPLAGMLRLFTQGADTAGLEAEFAQACAAAEDELSIVALPLSLSVLGDSDPHEAFRLIERLVARCMETPAYEQEHFRRFCSRLTALCELAVAEAELERDGLYDTARDAYSIRLPRHKGFWGFVWNGIKYGWERLFQSGPRFARLKEMANRLTMLEALGFHNYKMSTRRQTLNNATNAASRAVGAAILLGEIALAVISAYFIMALLIVLAGLALLLLFIYLGTRGETSTYTVTRRTVPEPEPEPDVMSTIRINGTAVGTVDNGYVRVNGTCVGTYNLQGDRAYVYHNSTCVGTVDSDGYVRINDRCIGTVDDTGYLRVDGTCIGTCDGDKYDAGAALLLLDQFQAYR